MNAVQHVNDSIKTSAGHALMRAITLAASAYVVACFCIVLLLEGAGQRWPRVGSAIIIFLVWPIVLPLIVMMRIETGQWPLRLYSDLRRGVIKTS